MIEIDDILISDAIVESRFVCDLQRCKGGCCVEGDAGAPITEEEAQIIDGLYPLLEQEMLPEAIEEVRRSGTSNTDEEFDIVTPTIGDGLCVYGYYDEHNIVKCLIEKLYNEGKTAFKKPISCHLFPIRVDKTEYYTMLNYEPRPVLCAPACSLGEQLRVPVYQFLKEPIIRQYGEDFYHVLHDVAVEHYGVE